MYTASVVLLVIYLTTSHQEELHTLMSSIEPSETVLLGEFKSDLTFGVSPTEVLTPDYSTPDTTETLSSIFTDTDNTETGDYSLGDTTDVTSPIDTFTEATSTDLLTTAESDSDSTAPLVDTTSAPINTTLTPTKTTKPATPKITTTVNFVNATSTTELFNSTNSSTADDRDDDSLTFVIVGAVIGGAAGAGAAVAIATLAWRNHRRHDLNSKDEFTPGLKDAAASSQRRPNTYIVSMSSNVRNETTTSAVYGNAAEVYKLNTLKATDANVNARPDNDRIYNNTNLASSNENDALYNNTPGPSGKGNYVLSKHAGGPVMLEKDEMYNNTSGLLDTQPNAVLKDAGGSLNSGNSDIYINSGMALGIENDELFQTTDGPLGEESGVLIANYSRALKAESDDVYVTADVDSNVDDGGDSEAENEGLYEKPDGPRNLETEDLFETYDGAPITKVKPHQDAHITRDTARLSTDSLYINVPKELPPQVCGVTDMFQTGADDADVDNEYVNIKSVETLRDKTEVAVDDVLAAADAGLDDFYINTEQAKRLMR